MARTTECVHDDFAAKFNPKRFNSLDPESIWSSFMTMSTGYFVYWFRDARFMLVSLSSLSCNSRSQDPNYRRQEPRVVVSCTIKFSFE